MMPARSSRVAAHSPRRALELPYELRERLAAVAQPILELRGQLRRALLKASAERTAGRSRIRPCRRLQTRSPPPRSRCASKGVGSSGAAHQNQHASIARACAQAAARRQAQRAAWHCCSRPRPSRARSEPSARRACRPAHRPRAPSRRPAPRRPLKRAAWRALSRALASKVLPLSSTQAMPRADCSTRSMPCARSSAANSRCLPALALASTTRRARSRHRAPGPAARTARRCRPLPG